MSLLRFSCGFLINKGMKPMCAIVQCRNISSAFTRHGTKAPMFAAVNLAVGFRSISSQELTKNIQLITPEKRNLERDPKTLKLKTSFERPLVLMLAWLQANQKHLLKYAGLYIDQGFDVLAVSVTPWQLLWPVKGTQLVAIDVLNFLQNNPAYSPILLHGFSIGGYVWGECMVHMARDVERYQPIIKRIAGQIWDSAADITEIPIGVPKALFPRNAVLQSTLKKYMIYHLKTFHESATSHYIRSSQMFHSTLIKSPALFLVSKTDPVGAESSNQRVRENYESLGIKTYWKCWDRSPHVGHYQKHPKEYTHHLASFMESVALLTYPEKIRAKL